MYLQVALKHTLFLGWQSTRLRVGSTSFSIFSLETRRRQVRGLLSVLFINTISSSSTKFICRTQRPGRISSALLTVALLWKFIKHKKSADIPFQSGKLFLLHLLHGDVDLHDDDVHYDDVNHLHLRPPNHPCPHH